MDSIIESIRRARHGMLKLMDMPDECRMADDAYIALRAAALPNAGITTTLPDTVFGMKVVIDRDLPPGTWKLVSPNDRARERTLARIETRRAKT